VALEEEGVEGGDVFDECGPAPGVSNGFDEVDENANTPP